MNPSVRDISFMRRALELAARGLGTVEPNPMVGAVLVQGDRIVGEGFTAPFGGPHAEVEALRAAGDKARGAELFVSLEPCCHFGKTPPCTDAILAAGVRRVVAAVEDPFPAVSGKGLAALAAAGLETSVGVLAQEARLLNAAFFKRQLTGLPLVIAKWAMTLDGRIATAAGDSRWISSEESRRRVHEVRRVCDAVLVGSGTALKDSPSLTVRHVAPLPARGQPTRVIVDARLRIDPAAEPVISARQTPVLIYTTPQGLAQNAARAAALRDAGCEVATVPQADLTGATGNITGATGDGSGATGGLPASANAAGVSLRAVLEDLGRRGMSRVLVEGGPQVFASLFAEGLADRVMIFVAPKILAISGAPGPVAGPDGRTLADAHAIQDLQTETLGPDLLIHGRLGEF
jgi:diaminohydroxyphosphoribosylaminopyrimidine deaminase / 5-amino-6-(5-phosphoribosylamino)uracil reductase